jgi:outer membrane immunogenic protein
MKRPFYLLALVAFLFAGLGPAHAQKSPWTGFHVGAHGGLDMTSTDVGVGGPGGIRIDGLSGNGIGYGGHVGFDYQFPGGKIVVGGGADYTWANADFKASIGGAPLLTAGITRSWAVTGRIGLDMGGAMPYVLAGYTRADGSAALLGTPIGSTTLDGWIAGGGVEIALANNLFVAGEYRYTRFDSLSFGGGALTLDPERHEVRAAVKYRFNPL